MALVINGLADQPKHFAELNKLLVVTSGHDPVQYVDLQGGRSGELGFAEWSGYWDKPTGSENATGGSLTTGKFFSLVVTPLNERRSSNVGFVEGNPTAPALPVEIVDAADDSTITWTIPVHPQTGIYSLGSHDGADNAAVLTDSGQAWETNDLVGKTLKNLTDGSSTTITANTATTVTGVLSGGTDDDWDINDEYQVVDDETTARRVYVSRGDTAADAWAGPFYLADVIEDNTTTTWEQTAYAATGSTADFDRFRPPSARFCHEAYNRIWYTGSIRELRGKVEYQGTVETKSGVTFTVTATTSDYGGVSPVSGQVLRYDIVGTFTAALRIGSVVNVTVNGGTMDPLNVLTNAIVTQVEDIASPTWFEVVHTTGVAEAGVTGDITMKPNYVVGNLSGANQTYFSSGMVGATFSINASPATPVLISWVDEALQEVGFTGNYLNTITGQQEFELDSNIELYWSISLDGGVVPVDNVIPVPGRPFALGHLDRHVLIWTDSGLVKLAENNIGQGFYTISESLGTTAPYSVVRTPRGYTYFDGEGLSRTDGVQASSISKFKADDYLRNVNQEAVYNIRGIYDPQEDQLFYVFPLGTELLNNFGLIINESTSDFYPIKLLDANALWRERSADGKWNIFHGSTNRNTESGKSYIWEHDFDFESDGLTAGEGWIGQVTAVDTSSNYLTVAGISTNLIVPGAVTTAEPYQYEGVPAVVVDASAATEAHFIVKKIDDNLDGTFNVYWGDDFDLDSLVPADGLAFFLGPIPIHFGPKFTDFGSPRFAHSIKELAIDFEEPTGDSWVFVDYFKDGMLDVVKTTVHFIGTNRTRLVSPCRIGKTYQFGYRLRVYSQNRIPFHNMTVTFTTHT